MEKHHYVPQSLLNNFKYDDNKVFVCDKNSGRIFPSSIIDAGSENYFNTVDRNGERINFESLFQKNDDKLSFLIKKLVEKRNVSSLLADEKEQLLSIMVVQILRTKTYRTSIGEMFEHLNELFSKNESNYDLKKLDENNIRESVLTSLSDFQSLIKAMSGKVGLLYKVIQEKILLFQIIQLFAIIHHQAEGLDCHLLILRYIYLFPQI
ncbi:DUF4238 domain-containing protein [Vibrio metschnikovii]